MALIPFPSAAASRVTAFGIRATYPGQVVLRGLTGGVSTLTRGQSWAGSIDIAPVDTRTEAGDAGAIAAFVGAWGSPANTAEVPIIGPALPGAFALGVLAIRATGAAWYDAFTAGLVAGQYGRIGNRLVMVAEVEPTAVRLLPQVRFAVASMVTPASTVLARSTTEATAPISTATSPDRAGPWSLTWVEVIG